MSTTIEVIGVLLGLALLAMSIAMLVLLHKIDFEFRANHGRSLRDAVDRSEKMVRRNGERTLRLEEEALAVRSDLAESHDRADAAEGPPGEAADAAARSSTDDG